MNFCCTISRKCQIKYIIAFVSIILIITCSKMEKNLKHNILHFRSHFFSHALIWLHDKQLFQFYQEKTRGHWIESTMGLSISHTLPKNLVLKKQPQKYGNWMYKWNLVTGLWYWFICHYSHIATIMQTFFSINAILHPSASSVSSKIILFIHGDIKFIVEVHYVFHRCYNSKYFDQMLVQHLNPCCSVNTE